MTRPSASISVALVHAGISAPVKQGDRWTRISIFEWLQALAQDNIRTLVGIDCNFGYSEEVGKIQFGSDYQYTDLWNAVDVCCAQTPDFFAGGYWQHKDHRRYFWEAGRMPDGFITPLRLTEQACIANGLGVPESPFKLLGPKQVGKGGLAGMRMLHSLKRIMGERLAVWPFEQNTDNAVLVITEIYPRLFLKMSGHGNAKVRTKEELNAALTALESHEYLPDTPFSDHDADALVSAAGLRHLCGNGKTVPEAFSHPSALQKAMVREGWIFGVKA